MCETATPPPTPTLAPKRDCKEMILVNDNSGDSYRKVYVPLATVTGSGAVWTLTNKSYNVGIDAETEFELIFNVVNGDRKPEISIISFNENLKLCYFFLNNFVPDKQFDLF